MKNKITARQTFEDIVLKYKEQEIEVLIKVLEHLKSFGATHFDVYVNQFDGYIQDIEFTPVKLTYETEEERISREEKEKQIAELKKKELYEAKELEERAMLQRLKEKYEKI